MLRAVDAPREVRRRSRRAWCLCRRLWGRRKFERGSLEERLVEPFDRPHRDAVSSDRSGMVDARFRSRAGLAVVVAGRRSGWQPSCRPPEAGRRRVQVGVKQTLPLKASPAAGTVDAMLIGFVQPVEERHQNLAGEPGVADVERLESRNQRAAVPSRAGASLGGGCGGGRPWRAASSFTCQPGRAQGNRGDRRVRT